MPLFLVPVVILWALMWWTGNSCLLYWLLWDIPDTAWTFWRPGRSTQRSNYYFALENRQESWRVFRSFHPVIWVMDKQCWLEHAGCTRTMFGTEWNLYSGLRKDEMPWSRLWAQSHCVCTYAPECSRVWASASIYSCFYWWKISPGRKARVQSSSSDFTLMMLFVCRSLRGVKELQHRNPRPSVEDW